ncbi:hypothetical protein HB943_11900 [Listeria weihenstephanensis]|uniref:non-specific serine/threonine protein kinase n=1 Tax=Listeria weihenstephanensis TaxID=1006155 RepID=A0A841ZA06_9LIST|nr:WxL domain-containing protein [Listeria weihenstephanensis]MBC1501307.1 hypothetical protein [Listeria weihenstephanensis]
MLKKIMATSIILVLLPIGSLTPVVASTWNTEAPKEERTEIVTDTTTEIQDTSKQNLKSKVKSGTNLKAIKIDTDIVASSDLGDQAWLVNEVKRQVPSKTVGVDLTFGDLKTITVISLNSKGLTGSIPPEIKYFSNLVILNLYNNNLTGSIPAEIGSLSKLEQMSIQNNLLTGTIPKELGNLTSLRSECNLANNQLTGTIPEEIGNLTNFTGALNFCDNELTGAIPASFSNLVQMSSLQLQNTQLTGLFPVVLMQSTALTELNVSYTQLISPTLIPSKGNFTQTISNDQLEVSMKSVVYNTANDTTFQPFSSSSRTRSDFKLVNRQAPGVDVPFYDTHTVQIFDHAQNKVVYDGLITSGVSLDLTADTNRFTFYLDGVTQNSAAIADVDILSNVVQTADFDNQSWLIDEIEKQIPEKKIGTTLTFEDLKQITSIRISGVPTTGYIPDGMRYLTELRSLFLVNMQLTGTIPESITTLGQLTELNLIGNNIHGALPDAIGNLTNLVNISLADNALTGEIPTSIGNLDQLITLSLSNNELSGGLPSSIGGLRSLINLVLHDNQFSKEIPSEIGELSQLQALFLNNNQFSGRIPASLGQLDTLQTLTLENNALIGMVPVEILNIGYLTLMDNQVTYDSATIPGVLVNNGSYPRYTDTFLMNSQLAGAHAITSDATLIRPFDPRADTYFNLHYTNDGTTRQELLNTHTITIIDTSTDQIVYEGVMDSGVAFTQEGSTTYRVVLDQAPENPNNTMDITLQQNKLALTSIPDVIDFGTKKIASTTESYQRADVNWRIEVEDTRKNKQDWQLTAKMIAPMTGTNGQVLSEGLIYKDRVGSETPLSQQALAVYTHHPADNSPDKTTITWEEDRGVLLKVKAGEAYAQEYQGQVEWSLVDAP